jgi:diadenylate cyclase
MQSLDLSIFKITLPNVLDILLVAFIIYQLYNLIRGTIAVNILIGMGVIYALYFVVKLAHMQLLTEILGYFRDFAVIIIVIVFQQPAETL